MLEWLVGYAVLMVLVERWTPRPDESQGWQPVRPIAVAVGQVLLGPCRVVAQVASIATLRGRRHA